MNKFFSLSAVFASVFILTSCYSLEQFPIEHLVPADVSFPTQIRKVGIVNNVNPIPDNQFIAGDTTRHTLEIARKVTYPNGNPQITTQSLAEAIAEQNYFDVVVICDSALRANDIHVRETTLSQSEVKALVQELDVDMIIALENIQLKIQRIINMIPGGESSFYWGTVDAKILPSIAVYLPHRTNPLVHIHAHDSIFWEKEGQSEARLRSAMISEEQVIKEASEFAGSIPMKHLLPYWTTSHRFLYSGGDPNMRDAAIYVKENDWENAAKLWKTIAEGKNNKKKMRAAFNLAVYYELQDNLTEADNWLQKAIELSKSNLKNETVFIDSEPLSISNEKLYQYYEGLLKKRIAADYKLKVQMERFN